MSKFDTEVFDRFPPLRHMVGSYGDPVLKIRPKNDHYKPILSTTCGELKPEVWSLIDCDGWRRELLKSDVRGVYKSSSVGIKSISTIEPGWRSVGLLVYIPTHTLALLPFEDDAVIEATHLPLDLIFNYTVGPDWTGKEKYIDLDAFGDWWK